MCVWFPLPGAGNLLKRKISPRLAAERLWLFYTAPSHPLTKGIVCGTEHLSKRRLRKRKRKAHHEPSSQNMETTYYSLVSMTIHSTGRDIPLLRSFAVLRHTCLPHTTRHRQHFPTVLQTVSCGRVGDCLPTTPTTPSSVQLVGWMPSPTTTTHTTLRPLQNMLPSTLCACLPFAHLPPTTCLPACFLGDLLRLTWFCFCGASLVPGDPTCCCYMACVCIPHLQPGRQLQQQHYLLSGRWWGCLLEAS